MIVDINKDADRQNPRGDVTPREPINRLIPATYYKDSKEDEFIAGFQLVELCGVGIIKNGRHNYEQKRQSTCWQKRHIQGSR